MQITYKTEGDYVKGVKAECSPVEWLLISTGLELIADNPNLSIKDRRLAKKMIISVKDHDRLCNAFCNEDVLDKIISEATSLKISYTDHDKDTYRRGVNDVLKIIYKYKTGSEGE